MALYDNIDILVSEKDYGMYDALNKGIKLATGEIVGVLHADDFLASEDIIANVVKAFESSKADILYGNLWYVDKYDTDKNYT